MTLHSITGNTGNTSLHVRQSVGSCVYPASESYNARCHTHCSDHQVHEAWDKGYCEGTGCIHDHTNLESLLYVNPPREQDYLSQRPRCDNCNAQTSTWDMGWYEPAECRLCWDCLSNAEWAPLMRPD